LAELGRSRDPDGGHGLLGVVLAVEGLKRRLHIKHRTGDLFAIPLVVGIAIGRIGCFFAGLTDGTYGTATALPREVDFGDGVGRHPAQLYEIVAMILLYLAIRWFAGGPHRVGDVFRLFLTGAHCHSVDLSCGAGVLSPRYHSSTAHRRRALWANESGRISSMM